MFQTCTKLMDMPWAVLMRSLFLMKTNYQKVLRYMLLDKLVKNRPILALDIVKREMFRLNILST